MWLSEYTVVHMYRASQNQIDVRKTDLSDVTLQRGLNQ